MFRNMLSILCIMLLCSQVYAQFSTIEVKTQELDRHEGFFTYYWDENSGKIWLEITRFDEEFLIVFSLPAGLGSNDVGLDRGRLGGSKIVKFIRSGPKVFLIQPNYAFRATTNNEFEQKAVDEAFATSVIWGFDIAAIERGAVLVDATNFLLRDGFNAAGTLRSMNQGNFKLDPSRSALLRQNTKNFPLNTEFDVLLTFTGDNPGNFVRSVAPDPSAISLRQHYSLVQLPDDNYKIRVFDPRSGVGGISFMDYATPISEPIVKRFARRHRLEKKYPNAVISEAVEPIVYYVDRGVPEPIRSALIEGAQWWNEAFEAIGYKEAFRVDVMPKDADPMDIRYNVINWVHRSTRGWSYGGGVTDPRTGEILKGHVSLGSLRVRQDFLIAEGLLAPYEDDSDTPLEMEEMALARLRQLSAHEVGHTLGFPHNYYASVNGRASVMDYPHPLVTIDNNGSVNLSDAYDNSIGAWDKVAVAWAYSDYTSGTDESKALNKIITDALDKGMLYITDQDARPQGSAHPYAHLWDNGTNAVDELERVLKVRRRALENFSEKNIRYGMPMATLEEALVPIFLFHRYQLEAAAKVLGGANYFYTLRGDGQKTIEIVPPDEQRRALNMLLRTLTPAELLVEERIMNLIPPRPPFYGQTSELFGSYTGSTFDPLLVVESAANLTVTFLLNRERAARLIEYNARNNDYPGLSEIIDTIIDETWKVNKCEGLIQEAQIVVNNLVLHKLMDLSADNDASTQVRAIASLKIENLHFWIESQTESIVSDSQKAHFFFALHEIELFQNNPAQFKYSQPLNAPAGSPIGMPDNALCDYDYFNTIW